MAHISIEHRSPSAITEWVAHLPKRVRQMWTEYRLFQRTIDELQRLSDRELADLGLHRSEIRRVATNSVYGG